MDLDHKGSTVAAQAVGYLVVPSGPATMEGSAGGQSQRYTHT